MLVIVREYISGNEPSFGKLLKDSQPSFLQSGEILDQFDELGELLGIFGEVEPNLLL